MPRVSEEHLERRRRQILDAARTCFIRQGIHATSMQDIFAESGLSAGAVYRYFKSKSEIIEAILATVVGDLHARFDEFASSDPLPALDAVVEHLAVRLTELSADNGPVRLAPQAWSLGMHDPEIAGYAKATMAGLRDTWTRYLSRLVDAGALPADTDIDAAGKTMVCILPGFLVQHFVLGDVTPDELRRGARAVLRATVEPVSG